MANQANQPNKPDQTNKPQQSDPSRTPGQEKGRTPNEGGANRGNTDRGNIDEQRKGGTAPDRSNPAQQEGDRSRKGNNPDVTIPNPKNPGYGDNEPGDPRRMEVDADATKDTDKKNPRRT